MNVIPLQKLQYTDHDEERLIKGESPAWGVHSSEFERDRTSLLRSASFRKLQGKTQLFPIGKAHYACRTRMAHSLEVAQIGKLLALRLGADPDLLEAVSLAHDIGTPPFGHAGEEELKRLMHPYGGFDSNAQNIRILTKLEVTSVEYEGLNLTRAVIDGQLKYKEVFGENKGKFIYDADRGIRDWATYEACNAVKGSQTSWRSFECDIMDWADQVAYVVHDLQDSISSGYVGAFTFEPDYSPMKDVIDRVRQEYERCAVDVAAILRQLIARYNLRGIPDVTGGGLKNSRKQQKAAMERIASDLISRYTTAAKRIERELAWENPVSKRYLYTVWIPLECRVEVSFLKTLVKDLVIESPNIRGVSKKNQKIIRCLFEELVQANGASCMWPDDWKECLQLCDSDVARARRASDYIASMTDAQAETLYDELFFADRVSSGPVC